MDRGSWRAAVHAVAKSQTRLSNFHMNCISAVISGAGKCPHLSNLYWSRCFPFASKRMEAYWRDPCQLEWMGTALRGYYLWRPVFQSTYMLLFFVYFLNWDFYFVKYNLQLWKIWPCHAIVPLNICPRCRLFNQLSGAYRPHRSLGGRSQLTAAPALPRSPASLCETTQGGAQASPWRGSGCRNARCAIPTAAGGGPVSPRVKSRLCRDQAPEVRKVSTGWGEPKPCRAPGNTGWEIEHYSGPRLPPTSFVSFLQCLENLFKELFQVFFFFFKPPICLQKYPQRGNKDCLLAVTKGGNGQEKSFLYT